MNFNENELINKVLKEYYNTFSITLDTSDYVPKSINKKIYKFIYKRLNKKFREIKIYYLLNQKYIGVQLGFLDNLKIFLSGLENFYMVEHPDYERKINKFKMLRKKNRNVNQLKKGE